MTSRASFIRMLDRWQERQEYVRRLIHLAEANVKRAKTDKALADLERELTRLEIEMRICAERITHYRARIASLPTPTICRPRKLNSGPSRPQKRGVL